MRFQAVTAQVGRLPQFSACSRLVDRDAHVLTGPRASALHPGRESFDHSAVDQRAATVVIALQHWTTVAFTWRVLERVSWTLSTVVKSVL